MNFESEPHEHETFKGGKNIYAGPEEPWLAPTGGRKLTYSDTSAEGFFDRCNQSETA